MTKKAGRAGVSSAVAISLGGVLLLVGLVGGYLVGLTQASTTTPTTPAAHSSTSSECAISAEGAVKIRLISDVNGQIIQDAKMNGTLHNQCGDFKTDNFTSETGGWLSPVLKTTAIGVFTVSIQYSGDTYTYSAQISPLRVTCVTFSLPYGNLTSHNYQIGNGAVCPSS